MNLINIFVKINNSDAPYEYKGEAKEYKDIIEYDNLNENFVFDKQIERITKSSDKNKVVVDFKNEEIRVNSDNKELNIKIKVIKKEINEFRYYYLYEFDKMKIEFILEKEV